MGKHLVLAGGGHAHMEVLSNLAGLIRDGHRVSVIGPSPFHYYSGMGPGMLGGSYQPEEIRFATQQTVEQAGGVFVQDRVRRILPEKKKVVLESGSSVEYDVLSCNIGSHVPRDMVTQSRGDIYTVKPIEKLFDARRRILELLAETEPEIAVIGGGPAAAEVAGNIWQIGQQQERKIRITVFAGQAFMGRFSEKIQNRTRDILTRRGIVIRERCPVQEVRHETVIPADGEEERADMVFLAIGVKPPAVFRDSGIPAGPDGGLLTNTCLQSVAYPEIFGGGDCIYFQDQPLDKVGVYAVRENPVLYHNLVAALEGRALSAFDPGGDYLLIFNLGGGEGVLQKRGFTMSGKLAYRLKDYIDRKFMQRFQ